MQCYQLLTLISSPATRLPELVTHNEKKSTNKLLESTTMAAYRGDVFKETTTTGLLLKVQILSIEKRFVGDMP